jgi:hypothetical protein
MRKQMKLKTVLALFVLLICNILVAKAQVDGNPCPPDNTDCPLDTWVLALVFSALIFVSLHLYRRQKQGSL